MKILVTGANGYIGSKVCSFLDSLGHEVIACDINNSYLNSKIKFINFDIFVRDTVGYWLKNFVKIYPKFHNVW